MPNRDDIVWFKRHFQSRIDPALAGTPLTVDLITALACQETGEVWPVLRRKGLSEQRILRLCVGDSLDAPRRSAFPKNKQDLVARPHGAEMFAMAHEALVEMAQATGDRAYLRVAAMPHKFCRGFGLFQRDLQFFRDDPDYFLQRRYADFDQTLEQCVLELMRGLRKLQLHDRPSLTPMEMAAVGIVYNTGRFNPGKGLMQGHQSNDGRFYGQALFDFIRASQTVALPGEEAELPRPPPGEATVPPPSPITATGPFFKVDTRTAALRLREQPSLSGRIRGHLPDGHTVRAFGSRAVNGFMRVQTSLLGANLDGFAASRFLVRQPDTADIPVFAPLPAPPPGSRIREVTMPRRPGSMTRRRDPATAHSLNEPNPPRRQGATARQLRAELAAIIDHLAVDNRAHKRYQPHNGFTFCNIYAHDYCHLAGVYLPRVWWTAGALIKLREGRNVEPLIGNSIVEMRANDLFRWLREFGLMFGWRQTGTATKLQEAAFEGAVALIVARRRDDGRSGHIVAVPPETDSHRARRDRNGEVIAPLQSQAGVGNFRYGTGTASWWTEDKFAESAFWFHP